MLAAGLRIGLPVIALPRIGPCSAAMARPGLSDKTSRAEQLADSSGATVWPGFKVTVIDAAIPELLPDGKARRIR